MRKPQNTIRTPKKGRESTVAQRPKPPLPVLADCVYTVEETAGILRLHNDTVRRMLRRGDLEGSATPGGIRVRGAEVLRYLERTKIIKVA